MSDHRDWDGNGWAPTRTPTCPETARLNDADHQCTRAPGHREAHTAAAYWPDGSLLATLTWPVTLPPNRAQRRAAALETP